MAHLEIIAHRGGGAAFVDPVSPPENTLAAFEYAWQAGADAAELDLHLSRDGRLVVIHDETTDRTTNRAGLQVAEASWEELRTLDAGAWKGFPGARLPLLEEVIEATPAGKRLFIELKTGPEIVEPLARVLRRPFPLISFSAETIAVAKRRLPDCQCYWVVDFEEGRRTACPTLPTLLTLARAAGIDGIDFSVRRPEGFAALVRAQGLRCAAWTVNDAESARRLIEEGVTMLTTDLPRRLREELA